ncbi:hypothetical protein ACWY4P_45240 [Streptomyces sp. LZ34]
MADPIIRFNQLITVPYTDLLERREGQQVWQAAGPTFASQILGPHFEELARDWVRLYAADEAGITDIHDTEGRAKHELDVVALTPGDKPRTPKARIALLGEAKATARRRGVEDLERLEHIRTVLDSQGHDSADAALALFSQHGFTPPLREMAARRDDVHLIDLVTLYGRNNHQLGSRDALRHGT